MYRKHFDAGLNRRQFAETLHHLHMRVRNILPQTDFYSQEQNENQRLLYDLIFSTVFVA